MLFKVKQAKEKKKKKGRRLNHYLTVNDFAPSVASESMETAEQFDGFPVFRHRCPFNNNDFSTWSCYWTVLYLTVDKQTNKKNFFYFNSHFYSTADAGPQFCPNFYCTYLQKNAHKFLPIFISPVFSEFPSPSFLIFFLSLPFFFLL